MASVVQTGGRSLCEQARNVTQWNDAVHQPPLCSFPYFVYSQSFRAEWQNQVGSNTVPEPTCENCKFAINSSSELLQNAIKLHKMSKPAWTVKRKLQKCNGISDVVHHLCNSQQRLPQQSSAVWFELCPNSETGAEQYPSSQWYIPQDMTPVWV